MLRHEAAIWLNKHKDDLAIAITNRLFAGHGEYMSKTNLDRRNMIDYAYHDISKLYVAILGNRPQVFSDYILWQRMVLEKRMVPLAITEQNLVYFKETILGMMPEKMHEVVVPVIDAGFKELRSSLDESISFIDKTKPLGKTSEQYLNYALNNQIDKVRELISDAIEKQKISIRQVFLQILQPVQYEIGRLWQLNKLSVASEHLVTDITLSSMNFIKEKYQPQTVSQDKTIVSTCLGRELHDIGIRFVSNFFSINGWSTYYLGANMPTRDILEALEKYNPDVLAISATMSLTLPAIRNLINEIRHSDFSDIKILVGGYGFNLFPSLYSTFDADSYAPDAEQAVIEAEKLIGN